MKTGLIIAVVIIAVVVIGFFFFQQGNQDNNQVPELSAEEEAKLDTANGEPTMQSETKVEIEPLAGSISPYYEFDKELYDKALAENKVIVLYFYADWCPICAKEQRDATLPAFNEIEKDNLIGFRVHYNDGKVTDFEKELAKQFGITYQHTKIILKDNKQVLKDLNSWGKNKYLEELNKYG